MDEYSRSIGRWDFLDYSITDIFDFQVIINYHLNIQ